MENEYDNEKTENSKTKESFIVKFLNFCVAVVEGIFGLTSYNDSVEDNDFESENEDEYEDEDENANDSETENVFSYGDTVMVKYNGKVGVIVDVSGNYYTLKLKDEFENDYYASYYENELERYD